MQVWVSLLWAHCSFLLGPGVHKFCLFSPSAVSPVSCKFWWLYGGVKGSLLQEGLCHSQVCCTQSSCPCGSPLLTRTSTGDTKVQLCLSPCGTSGSWCAQGMFEPSECLWWIWGLILKVISPLLPFCWGLFFALECGVSPQRYFQHIRTIVHLQKFLMTLSLDRIAMNILSMHLHYA